MGVYSNNRTLLGESHFTSHPLELMIEQRHEDLELFNKVIAGDFREAYCEAGLLFLTEEEEKKEKEEKKEGIWAKIKAFFKKIIDAIKGLFGKAKDKIKEAAESNTEFYKKNAKKFITQGTGVKFKSSVSKENLNEILTGVTSLSDKFSNIVADIHAILEEGENKIKRITDIDGYDDKANTIIDETIKAGEEKEKEKFKELNDLFGKSDEEKKDDSEQNEIELTSDMMGKITNIVGAPEAKIVNIITKTSDSMVKVLEEEAAEYDAKKDVYDYENDVEKADHKRTVKESQKLYDLITKFSKIIVACSQEAITFVKKMYSLAVSIFKSVVATIDSKDEKKDEKSDEKKEEKKVDESYLAGMLSDIEMEQILFA